MDETDDSPSRRPTTESDRGTGLPASPAVHNPHREIRLKDLMSTRWGSADDQNDEKDDDEQRRLLLLFLRGLHVVHADIRIKIMGSR